MAQDTTSSAPRLFRTTQNAEGLSVLAKDAQATSFAPLGPDGVVFNTFDIRESIPVNNSDAIPTFERGFPKTPQNGAIFVTTDFPPGAQSMMHKTASIDYAVVVTGEIVMKLDGGEETVVKAGESIVQQGANHQWLNKSDKLCRVAFVMVGAQE